MTARPEGARSSARTITSLQNERVKMIRALHMRKARRENGLFVAEGASLLVTARDAGWKPKILVFLAGSATGGVARDLVRWAEAAGAERLEVSQAVLAKLAAKENPQTMLGVFEQVWKPLPAPITVSGDAVWVGLEAARDPGNLGTIIRTVDAAGASGVALIGASVDPYSHEAVRATMGSIFAVPLYKASVPEFLAWRQGWPGAVVGTLLTASVTHSDADYRRPTMILMGNEQQGLPPEMAALCDVNVKIPMRGRADSLNLSVATGIMIYAATGDL
jgi:TrmH family RNA methyltransferase